jgi:hypothetical protein
VLLHKKTVETAMNNNNNNIYRLDNTSTKTQHQMKSRLYKQKEKYFLKTTTEKSQSKKTKKIIITNPFECCNQPMYDHPRAVCRQRSNVADPGELYCDSKGRFCLVQIDFCMTTKKKKNHVFLSPTNNIESTQLQTTQKIIFIEINLKRLKSNVETYFLPYPESSASPAQSCRQTRHRA